MELTYYPARKKVQKELEEHQKTCALKVDPIKSKEVLQDKWVEENKKSHVHNAYSCRQCWGKVYWDKSIAEVGEAEKQAIADLIYHEKHECDKEGAKRIVIYFSPNQGGNEHAPLSYSEKVNKEELMLEKIYEGQVSQNQEKPTSQNTVDWTPWIVGGGLLLVGGLLLIWLLKKRKLTKSKKGKK